MRLMIRHARLLYAAAKVMHEQRRLIDRLAADKEQMELQYMRIGRDLIEQFLITLDTPENHEEIRDRLKVSLGFYRDEIAVREEQTP